MAGSDPTGAFVGASFVEAIRRTIYMAMPADINKRPIYYFPATQAKDPKKTDRAGSPFDFTGPAPTPSGKDPVYSGTDADQVLTIWDAGGAGRKVLGETPFGNFDPSRLAIVILSHSSADDYAKIQGFDRVVISGDTYTFEAEDPVVALFDVDVHVAFVVSADAS